MITPMDHGHDFAIGYVAPRGGTAIASMIADMGPEIANFTNTFTYYKHIRIGRAYLRAFLEWFLHADRAIALVAKDHTGLILGYVVGVPLGYTRSMNRDLFWVAGAGVIIRPWLFLSSPLRSTMVARLRLTLGYAPVPHAEPDIPGPTMSLVSLAVSLSMRGHHVGRHLVEASEGRVRQLRMRSIRLSVYPSNTGGRCFYERCGWLSFSEPLRATGEMYYFRVLDTPMHPHP